MGGSLSAYCIGNKGSHLSDNSQTISAVRTDCVASFRFTSKLEVYLPTEEAARRTTARRTCQHQRIPQPPIHRQLQENGLHPGSMYSTSRSHTHRHSSQVWHSSERHPIDGRGRQRQMKLKPKEVARRTQLASYHLVFQYCTFINYVVRYDATTP